MYTINEQRVTTNEDPSGCYFSYDNIVDSHDIILGMIVEWFNIILYSVFFYLFYY